MRCKGGRTAGLTDDDAAFVAVAQAASVPLITTDETILRCARVVSVRPEPQIHVPLRTTSGARRYQGFRSHPQPDPVLAARVRRSPLGVERFIGGTAERDAEWARGRGYRPPVVVMEQEPAASGKGMIDHYRRNVLARHDVRGVSPSGSK